MCSRNTKRVNMTTELALKCSNAKDITQASIDIIFPKAIEIIDDLIKTRASYGEVSLFDPCGKVGEALFGDRYKLSWAIRDLIEKHYTDNGFEWKDGLICAYYIPPTIKWESDYATPNTPRKKINDKN